MRVVGIVTARGGSKGIPGKNVRLLRGKPLLQYTAEAALASRGLNRVILSTEDEQLATIGRSCGLEVPFLRPAELARDDTPTLPVLQHAVGELERQGDRYDAVCLLQPTNPLRSADDIDGCIAQLENSGADAVVTVLPIPAKHNPHWAYFQTSDGYLRLSTGETNPIPRRQDLPPAFHREGSVYLTRRDVLMEGNSLYGKLLTGYVLDADRCVSIDDLADWARAEQLLESR